MQTTQHQNLVGFIWSIANKLRGPYFNCLKSYLNTAHYGEPQAKVDEVILKEKVFGQSGSTPIEYKVSLQTTGEVLVIKLDTKKNGSAPPLFHFLDDNAKPWSKRCDFVVFNLRKTKLHVYCLEFKSESGGAKPVRGFMRAGGVQDARR